MARSEASRETDGRHQDQDDENDDASERANERAGDALAERVELLANGEPVCLYVSLVSQIHDRRRSRRRRRQQPQHCRVEEDQHDFALPGAGAHDVGDGEG